MSSCTHQDKVSDGAKFTAAAKQKLNKEDATELKLEVSEYFNACSVEIGCLAKKYSKSISHIKQLLNNESNYKNTWEPSLWNVLVHAKTLEINEGKLKKLFCHC
jgi:hypothetical protein